jgi:tetratricopeptide (TPR) repeat protein
VNRDGVIICNGDIDILPLWYLQHVVGLRPEVAVFTMQLIPYDWYRDPLFTTYPFLKVPVGYDVRPETVVQDMINQHAPDRSFYYTNIFTAPWMQKDNQSLPEGFLWRIIKTKNLNYVFTSRRLNVLWDTYRLRSMDPPSRGYWDEYTDVMKDSYGIGYEFTGMFSLINKAPDVALWSFNNSLKYRQPQTFNRIYFMLGETYMALGRPESAANSYQMAIQRGAQDPHTFARLGDAFAGMKDYGDARSAYQAALQGNPNEPSAQAGISLIDKMNNARGGKDSRS